MIVDLHTHIWDTPDQLGLEAARRIRLSTDEPWDQPNAGIDRHSEAMAPVDFAVVLGFESEYLGASIDAEQVAKYIAHQPGKYLGFAGIDPMANGHLRKIDRAVELGLVGVVISPAAQAFHPTHTRAMKLYEKCEKLNLPVLIHTGTHFGASTLLEYSQPFLFDEIARSFPGLRMVISQVGYPWIDQTLVLISKHEHVYADLSNVSGRPWQLYNTLLLAHQQDATRHLLLGSDFPFANPEEVITTLYSINTLTQGTNLPSVPRESLRSIVERDTLSCLGIQTPPASEVVDRDPVEEDLLSSSSAIAMQVVVPSTRETPIPPHETAAKPQASSAPKLAVAEPPTTTPEVPEAKPEDVPQVDTDSENESNSDADSEGLNPGHKTDE